MEFTRYRKPFAAAAFVAVALAGCTIDSYLTDPSNVHCDGRRTKTELAVGGMATFIVHGKEDGRVAAVQVRRTEEGASVMQSGYNELGPPQQIEADGYSPVQAVVDGPELSTFAAGGAWIIDVRENSVVIQGSCDGM